MFLTSIFNIFLFTFSLSIGLSKSNADVPALHVHTTWHSYLATPDSIRQELERLEKVRDEFYFQAKYDSADHYSRVRIQLAQSVGDTVQMIYAARELIKVAIKKHEYEGLIPKIDSLLNEAEKAEGKQFPLYQKLRFIKGRYYYERQELDSTISINLGILHAYRTLAIDSAFLSVVHNELALSYFMKDDLGQAMISLQQAQDHSLLKDKTDSTNFATLVENLGILQWGIENYQGAIAQYEKAITYRLRLGVTHTSQIAYTYNNLSVAYSALGQYNKARLYQELALTTLIKLYGPYHSQVLLDYSNLIYRYSSTGYMEKVMELLPKTLAIIDKSAHIEAYTAANLYNNLGVVYLILQDYPKARHYLEKAIHHEKGLTGENSKDMLALKWRLVECQLREEKHGLAYKNIQLLLPKVTQIVPAKSRKMTMFYREASSYFKLLGQADSAIHYTNKAIEANTMGFTKLPNQPYPSADKLIDRMLAVEVYQQKIDLLESVGQTDLHIFETMVALMDNMRSERLYLRNYNKYLKHELDFANKYQRLLVGQHKHNELLRYLENRKGQILLDWLLNYEHYDHSNDPKQQKLTYYFRLRDYYKKKLFRQDDGQEHNKYSGLIAQYNLKIDSIKHTLYLEGKPQAMAEVDLDQMKATLNNRLLVHYTIIDSIYYAICASADTTITIALHEQASIDLLAHRYAKSISGAMGEVFDSDNSYLLYQNLVAPIIERFAHTDLLISPVGYLHRINFGALNTQQDTYSPLLQTHNPQFVYNFALAHRPSHHLPSKQLPIASYTANREIEGLTMAMAAHPDTILTRSGTYFLPGADWESRQITKLWGGNHYERTTPLLFKASFGKHRLVHIATHAIADSLFKEKVGVLFNKDQKDSLDDGFMNLAEISLLNAHNTELVFLSACETGNGKYLAGEGLQSIAYAFSHAGAKSVIMTQWKIPDETAAQVVIRFYKNLKRGMHKSEALRQAKLSYLENQQDPLKRHPYFWAGFVLVGNDGPVASSSYPFMGWGAITMLFFASLGALGWAICSWVWAGVKTT